MHYAGIGLLVLVLFGGAWWIARLMTSLGRNDAATHGGGWEDMTTGAEDCTDITGEI